MAIVIPSKHIYSKTFDPVIDNNIGKVEIGAKTPSIITKNEAVAEQTVEDFVSKSPDYYENISGYGAKASGDNQVVAVFARIEQIKYTPQLTFSIDEIQNNKLVQRLITGLSQNGNSNIVYTIYGDYEQGTVRDGTSSPKLSGSGTDISMVERNFAFKAKSTSTDTVLDLSTATDISITAGADFSLLNHEVSTSVKLSDIGSVYSATPTKTDGVFSITFDILAGLKWYTATLYNSGIDFGSTYNAVVISGDYEIYTPKRVEITINGVVLELNLTDNTVKIGDGNKTFSLDGNELTQTTNTPTVESKYQEIIDHWQNGKQTAVISCPITNYYYENGGLAVGADNQITAYLFTTKEPEAHLYPDGYPIILRNLHLTENSEGIPYIYAEFDRDSEVQPAIREQIVYEGESTWVRGFINSGTTVRLFCPNKNGAWAKACDTWIKAESLTFQIGDTVIPYVYTNKGDKPLSYNKDLTPKQFKVVGVSISKKQGVTQELTLQEV